MIKLFAPVIPFLTEEMYQNLVVATDPSAPESIHHCDFPKVEKNFVDEQLVKDVDQVISIVKVGRSLRNQSNIKVRQPLSELVVRPDSSMSIEALKKYEQHIKEELNIKNLLFANDDSELVEYELKVDFKLLGPKYSKDLTRIQKYLAKMPVKEVVRKVRAQLGIELSLNGRNIVLNPDEIIIETKPKENFMVQETDGMLLGLNTYLTDELLSEGIARDLVRHIQELRKEADFEMNDRIHLYYEGSDKINQAFTEHVDYIKAETLSLDISDQVEDGVFIKEVKLSGEKVKLGVKLWN